MSIIYVNQYKSMGNPTDNSENGNKIHAFPSFQELKPAYCVMEASTGAMRPNGDGLPGLQSH